MTHYSTVYDPKDYDQWQYDHSQDGFHPWLITHDRMAMTLSLTTHDHSQNVYDPWHYDQRPVTIPRIVLTHDTKTHPTMTHDTMTNDTMTHDPQPTTHDTMTHDPWPMAIPRRATKRRKQ